MSVRSSRGALGRVALGAGAILAIALPVQAVADGSVFEGRGTSDKEMEVGFAVVGKTVPVFDANKVDATCSNGDRIEFFNLEAAIEADVKGKKKAKRFKGKSVEDTADGLSTVTTVVKGTFNKKGTKAEGTLKISDRSPDGFSCDSKTEPWKAKKQ